MVIIELYLNLNKRKSSEYIINTQALNDHTSPLFANYYPYLHVVLIIKINIIPHII